jgi:myosin-5
MKSEVHPVDASHMRDLDNLCDMNSLHEAPLLHMIHKRFLRDKIYAFVGNVLLSINPYRDIAGLYGSAGDFVNSYVPDMDSDPIAKMMRPTESKSTTLPTPHVFTIASQALARLEHPRKDIVDAEATHGTIINQSIIITGESGAGKTEAAKHVIHFLTEASLRTTNPLDQDGTGVAIQDLIEKANCVFESFGNAATVRNSNSSRFGKFTKLLYNNENSLSASSTETFLLEKSRLVCVGQYERNFHVFYQMIDGLRADNPRIAQSLRITTTRDFNLLGHHGSDQASSGCKHDDVEGFRNLCRAFDLLDISRQMQVTIWEILACIMHMGNIQCFGAHDSGDSHAERVYLKVSTMSLAEITDLLGVDCGEFETALTTQKVGASGLVRVLSIKDAQNNIHAVIKWMYQRLFTWLVANFNVRSMMLSPDKESESNAMSENKFIGILDIFGFEILGSNSFEQLCINYTNEQLQVCRT